MKIVKTTMQYSDGESFHQEVLVPEDSTVDDLLDRVARGFDRGYLAMMIPDPVTGKPVYSILNTSHVRFVVVADETD